jgi:putative FmdB family regulatory protein
MPTYEYACRQCGHRVEVVQSLSDEPLKTCGVCGGELRKVFHPAGVLFKGSGFYSTDNRAKPKAESSGSSGEKPKDGGERSSGRDGGGGDGGGERPSGGSDGASSAEPSSPSGGAGDGAAASSTDKPASPSASKGSGGRSGRSSGPPSDDG